MKCKIQSYYYYYYYYYYCVNFASEDFTQGGGGGFMQLQLINLILKLFNRGNFFDVIR